MQRTTNFTSTMRLPVRLIGLAFWITAFVLVGLCVLAFSETRDLRSDARSLGARLEALTGRERTAQQDTAPAPTAKQITDLAADIKWFNDLTGEQALPLPALIQGLETLVPEGVWVSQMVYSGDQSSLKLSLQSDQETRLPTALSALENADFLANVILERQLRIQQGRRTLVQYDVRAGLN